MQMPGLWEVLLLLPDKEFFSSVRSRELNKSLRAKKYLIWIQSISATGMITRSLSFEL